MKTFTLEEANALIPQISELVDDMVQVRDRIVLMGASLQSMVQRTGGNGGGKGGSEYVLLLQHFNASLSFFKDMGCELKDLDQGLVDFPALREGQLVYLCWRRGEERIGFWHDPDSGYASRRPL